ncbi:MAG TPA: radical SAM protein [Candidatus Polarisedimenticolia bacterium]|nr:radical SAM protein [Candidatus Polarisedimenticolia bacterium]
MNIPDTLEHPLVPLLALDTLWFQVAGTICNLRCTHCFISCAPDNHSHEMMTLDAVGRYLREAATLGVREYYFTGGEPFMNRDIFPILEATLQVGPATVLTNGLLLDPNRAARLRALSDASDYSLDLRVSLDGWGPRDHERIRGRGTFRRAVVGIRNLWHAGLNPVVTVTELADGVASSHGRERFLVLLRSFGLTRPRLKILPLFRIGAEEKRGRPYHRWERLAKDDLIDPERLQCGSGRMVTSRGVYVCPILIDHPSARMGESLSDSLRPFELSFSACYTCHVMGVTCRT